MLPKHDDAGRRWRDHRQMVNGVLWRVLRGVIYRHGVRALQTVYRRFSQWEQDGGWAKRLGEAPVRDDAVGTVEWSGVEWTGIDRLHGGPHPPARRQRA
ncbi:transposase [Streptomyces sp. BV286]|nr:transposase [Streptomyces sp. BV286]